MIDAVIIITITGVENGLEVIRFNFISSEMKKFSPRAHVFLTTVPQRVPTEPTSAASGALPSNISPPGVLTFAIILVSLLGGILVWSSLQSLKGNKEEFTSPSEPRTMSVLVSSIECLLPCLAFSDTIFNKLTCITQQGDDYKHIAGVNLAPVSTGFSLGSCFWAHFLMSILCFLLNKD